MASFFLAASTPPPPGGLRCPAFCLFKAPKYKWLLSAPSSSLSLRRSKSFLRRTLRVSLLAPVPGRTNRPVKALGALRLRLPAWLESPPATAASSSSVSKVSSAMESPSSSSLLTPTPPLLSLIGDGANWVVGWDLRLAATVVVLPPRL